MVPDAIGPGVDVFRQKLVAMADYEQNVTSNGEEFDGDLTTQARVIDEINFTHAARAEQGANLIATESRSWLDDHNR